MTAKEQVLKVYPDAQIRTLGYYRDFEHLRRQKFITTGHYIHIPTVWMPRADNPEQAWQSALTKINENGTRTIHTPSRNEAAEEA